MDGTICLETWSGGRSSIKEHAFCSCNGTTSMPGAMLADFAPPGASVMLLPAAAPPARPSRSRQTGQNSPENALPQFGQVCWGSVFTDLGVLPRGLTLRNEHGFPREPAAARLGNWVPGSEALATSVPPSSAKPVGALCWQAVVQLQFVTSRRSKARVSHAIRVWNKPF